ncbi:ribonuclease P protein component [bacterium]|uniref:Ribonuclease P protein component n=2 Tax=Katanobacteria TaxID=422282 RepID=A0A2M7WZT5_UNCKA|nr:ribonuclease P protein component [bacterium]PIP56807.1 MAG: ribonuclease P protein component [candidate division WWE3 bacterium CG22_combo_CG10-13_8_21_14_all_39_12]PJA39179.1 MAG: ribonuclease P protein component [candidate division WWE3 bacterium CG_4_9_14_3_um_filter_39_7]
MTSKKDIRYILSRGKKIHTPLFVMLIVPSHSSSSKYAFIAGKKVGNAIARNRAKRVLREAVRTITPQLTNQFNYIFIARSQTKEVKVLKVIETLEGIRSRIK